MVSKPTLNVFFWEMALVSSKNSYVCVFIREVKLIERRETTDQPNQDYDRIPTLIILIREKMDLLREVYALMYNTSHTEDCLRKNLSKNKKKIKVIFFLTYQSFRS
jgi:hypothetical protein